MSMLVPAVILAALWCLSPDSSLSEEEHELWRKVRAGQEMLARRRDDVRTGDAYAGNDLETADPHGTGMIGVEWSPVTTTLGSLEAKRTAADPLWSVWALRLFRRLGLEEGDRVALLSSSSFPGLVFSIVAASERAGLELFWIHSLGSSTWGANMPGMLWPEMARLLRSGGFISSKPDYYTPGAGAEVGLGLPPEGLNMLGEAAEDDDVPLLKGDGLDDMTRSKSELVRGFAPRLVINVGGAHTSFGGGVVQPGGGLYSPGDESRTEFGHGVLGDALESGVQVLHFLDMRSFSSRAGIPFDGAPRPRFAGAGMATSAAGLLVYALFLAFFRRWRRDE
ncbi:MAG: poly-gamma-glutamate system protein [Synergistaceae bacterium]|nr:poly-gamma-glutamate system protein [Synergistota bacterium]NLM71462.1 poly-gamma-glutamate system protein [Synergistaceae bacterium]